MTQQCKILIGTGSFLIVTLLVIVAFVLGVYVGEHGWTQEGLRLEGPRLQPRPAQPNPQQGQGQPGLPPGQPLPGAKPALVGRVQNVFDKRLQLVTPDGPRSVTLMPRTRIEDTTGHSVGLEALHKGQEVAIFGQVGGDGRTLEADLIILLPPLDALKTPPPDQRPQPQQPKP